MSPYSTLTRARSAVLFVAAGGLGVWLCRTVSRYGFKGTLNYVWVGDPYPDLREYLDALCEIEGSFERETKILTSVEEALDRARLDSVDTADEISVLRLWEKNVPDGDLRKQLAFLSDRLDKLAAKIDGVPALEKLEIRRRKKQLSTKGVALMERVDSLITFYRQARQER